MLLNLIGFALLAAIAFMTFRNARATGRSPWLWTLLAVGVGFAVQVVLPIFVFTVLIAFFTADGTSLGRAAGRIPDQIISAACVVLSAVALVQILTTVSSPHQEDVNAAPPPPPDFGANEPADGDAS